ncbi:MAG: Gfo/Idh/MocA family oxidoreductase [Actinomycetota bacterium]
MSIRVGIIGCGTVARRVHIPAFIKAGIEVVACASRSVASAEAAAIEAGAQIVDDWRDLIAWDGVDAIDICSPNAAHAEQAVAAAKARKHVLVEKPIAATLEQAGEIVVAAASAGVVLHVTQNLRYLAPGIAARHFLETGLLGEITAVRAAFGHSGPRDWAPDAEWFFEKESSGGGALIDLGIHIVDLVRYITGLEAERVSAMMQGGHEVEDAAQVIIRFRGGALGTINASWIARPAPDLSMTILGTGGILHFDARTPLTFRSAHGEKEEIELPQLTANPYTDFIAAIEGRPLAVRAATGTDGRAALAIVSAAYASASSGQTVDVSY